ncbi:MAG: zinc ribbon domain-containing protein [Promethearchaeota archaeon]
MHYERNQYSEGFSICGLIIAGAFLYWGFQTFWSPWIVGHWNLWWLGFIWIAIGLAIISSQIYALTNRGRLRTIIKNEILQNPSASVEELAQSTGISIKDVRAIVLDLKGRGELRGKFSSKTGQMKNVEVSEEVPEPPKGKFCSNCGTPIKKEDAMYCEFCGAKI